ADQGEVALRFDAAVVEMEVLLLADCTDLPDHQLHLDLGLAGDLGGDALVCRSDGCRVVGDSNGGVRFNACGKRDDLDAAEGRVDDLVVCVRDPSLREGDVGNVVGGDEEDARLD